MRQWVKLHTEILLDPKMHRLSDSLYRACVNLFALAGILDKDGQLGTERDVAFHLRIDEPTAAGFLADLAKVNITAKAKGVWRLKNWDKRNGQPPSASDEAIRERVRRYRKNKAEHDIGNETVTPLPDECNDPREDKSREEEIRQEENRDNGADAPPPPTNPQSNTAGIGPADRPDELPADTKTKTVGQRKFLHAFGAKRFKTTAQYEAVLALEAQYGTDRLIACAQWAAEKGMSLGDAVGAIKTAIGTWGQAKSGRPANGRARQTTPAPAPQFTPEEKARIQAELRARKAGDHDDSG